MAQYLQNLFSYNPFTGIADGITLVLDARNPRTGAPAAPQIACGTHFLAIEKNWQPPLAAGAKLHAASLRLIEPLSGARAFEVWVTRRADETKLYCFVDAVMPARVRLRAASNDVRAVKAVFVSDDTRIVMCDASIESYLVEFNQDGAEVDIWFGNGGIARLVRQGDEIVSLPLTAKEIAVERILQFNGQISELQKNVDADMKRRHGIIGGAVRLLERTSDRAAQDVLVDFLVEQQQYLPDGMRMQIRSILLRQSHPCAGTFLLGSSDNVVSLNSATSKGRAAQLAKKRVRAAEESARAQCRKGASGGGNQKRKKK